MTTITEEYPMAFAVLTGTIERELLLDENADEPLETVSQEIIDVFNIYNVTGEDQERLLLEARRHAGYNIVDRRIQEYEDIF